MTETAPIMPSGIHFAVTIFGGLFGVLSIWLIFQLFSNSFDLRLCIFTISSIGISADLLAGAFTRRYPFSVLLWLVPTNDADH